MPLPNEKQNKPSQLELSYSVVTSMLRFSVKTQCYWSHYYFISLMYNMVYFLDPVFWVLQECSNKLIYA